MKFALATIFVFSALALGQTNLIANVSARKTTSLNGTWHLTLSTRTQMAMAPAITKIASRKALRISSNTISPLRQH